MSSSAPLRYRMALDLGSTSLGWALFRLDAQNTPTAIIKAGVRIFSDGRNPKDGSSLAVTRRAARAMRRRRDRLLKRKQRMQDKLIAYGFFPQDEAARKALEQINPYELRAKGLEQALTPSEFGRALFHINQRRGFKSNRKTDKGENDASALKSAINSLRAELAAYPLDADKKKRLEPDAFDLLAWVNRKHENTQNDQPRTVGELLAKRMAQGQPVRARYRENKVLREDGKSKIEKSYDLYIDRQMIADEFDALWTKQASLTPALFTEAARADLRDTLLHQRKLRPVLPGRCTLEPDEPRAPLALPSQQRFRMLQEVNNLRLLDSRLQQAPLTLAQRDQIVAALESKSKITFVAIRKLLKADGAVQFNLEDEKRKELKGNATTAILSKPDLFGNAWHTFAEAQQDEIVWQLVSEESEAKLIEWLQQHTGIDAERAARIANAGLPEGYGSLSRKALNRILPHLRDGELVDGVLQPRTYDKAVQAAGYAHHSDLAFDFEYADEEIERIGERIVQSTGEIKPTYIFKQLPYYGRALKRHVAFAKDNPKNEEERYGKIANPTVHIGLNQVRVVVNALIKRYGRPTEIVVELARELKQSREQKLEAQKKQADNQKRRQRVRQEIADLRGVEPYNVKDSDIQKWILWEELSFDVADRRCPYSGVHISASMLLGPEVEIEHILPFSQTLDDSLNNRTVSMRQANRVKGNRSPWQAHADFAAQGWGYEGILQRAERMPRAKRYRFAPDGYEQWLRDDKGFLARALNDTRYLSRIAKEYLTLICPGSGVRVIPGQMTALLRGKFGLNSVLGLNGEKNRNDHRHHAVDACVIGVTDQGLLQRFAQASADARNKGLDRLVETMPDPWPTYRAHVERAVQHIWVSHKPNHGHEGAMMEETSYGIRKDGSIKQRRKADGSAGREISNLIRITEPTQATRHGVSNDGQPLPYKGYVGGSNYCIEIVCNEKGKWESEVISTFRAYEIVRRSGLERLRHPSLPQSIAESLNSKKLIMRLVIGDTVRLEVDGQTQTMRVQSISPIGQVFMAPIHEANTDSRNRNKADPFAFTSKIAGSFQKAKARSVSISPIGELRDPGFQG